MTFSYILAFIFVISTAAMAFASPESANAAMDGAQAAVSFTLSITGGICLWSGVMELMERCGITAVLGRLLHPLLRCLFPESTADASVLSALTDYKCTGISIISHAETSGLGAKAAAASEYGDWWRGQFVGEGDDVKLTKYGGNIDSITAATITSNAVSGAVAESIRAVEALG